LVRLVSKRTFVSKTMAISSEAEKHQHALIYEKVFFR